MTGAVFPYDLVSLEGPRLGLIALQSDETIERDMRRLLPEDVEFMVSRVPSDTEVTSETLAAMEAYLAKAAGLLPVGVHLSVVGYGCTSGTAQIGADKIAAQITSAIRADAVTNPLTGLIAACETLGIGRLAMLSPYLEDVSERLRYVLSGHGIDTPVFGSFGVGTEATVVRIAPSSIVRAARQLVDGKDVDGLFLSCTNLRALEVVDDLEDALGMPVLTSNQVLAWHMMRLCGLPPRPGAPGRLFRASG